jgi:uncharacterized protein
MVPDVDVGRRFREEVANDLLRARRDRDEILAGACRSILAAIDNAEAVPAVQGYDYSLPGLGETEAARRRLDHDDVRGLLDVEIGERRVAAEQYRALDQRATAERLEAEVRAIAGFRERVGRRAPGVDDAP